MGQGKRLFISQPMRGLTNLEIDLKRNDIIKKWNEEHKDEDWFIIPSKLDDISHLIPLVCLADSIKMLATADAIFMAKGWSERRGCCVEHICALFYGIKIVYEDPNEEADYNKLIK